MKKPSPEILKLPLEVRAEMALKYAVKQAIEQHAREGRSIFVWKDGKVVEITARELRRRSRAKKKRAKASSKRARPVRNSKKRARGSARPR